MPDRYELFKIEPCEDKDGSCLDYLYSVCAGCGRDGTRRVPTGRIIEPMVVNGLSLQLFGQQTFVEVTDHG